MLKDWKKIAKYPFVWKKGKMEVVVSVAYDKNDKNPLYRVIISDGKINRYTDYAPKSVALKFAMDYMKKN